MSLQTFLGTVGSTLEKGVTWIEGETDAAVTKIWSTGQQLFTAFEPTLTADAMAALEAFLPKIQPGQSLEDIEIAFLQTLEAEGSTLFGQIQAMASTNGSKLLQALIAMVQGALKLV